MASQFRNFKPKEFVKKQIEDEKKKSEGEELAEKILGKKKKIKIPKTKTPFEKLNEIRAKEKLEKAKTELKALEKINKYSKTKSGKFSKFVVSGFKLSRKGAITKRLYGQGSKDSIQGLTKSELRKIKLQLQISKLKNKTTPQKQRYYSPQQREYDNIFSNWSSDGNGINIAADVEREISGFNSNHGNAGDQSAHNMEREIMFHANATNRTQSNPLADISKEVFLHSNLQHLNSVRDIDLEVSKHANLKNQNVVEDLSKQVDFFSGIGNKKKSKKRRR